MHSWEEKKSDFGRWVFVLISKKIALVVHI